ncbi:helix-turn-helix domain-containing protein [Gordonia sp. 852002-10350_SCH5691597]|uniref:helix-turn-helix domain-containing protein n=1 Tax=Gordonia sp. 852002-10350_SCH5691597 TaxID=1834085 RepID=UPI0007EA5D26|nr:helix-turn-helix transcriptional regulator [Gordonia sp. 852002-10350_SCH5691597]OBA64285.1 hypothetical protein A5777_22175 [Gordonia sp. 852002-10350_SCH5691597]
MAAKKIEIDATGRTVALNVTILRATQGLSVAELAERATAAGRPLTRQAVSEIEAGRRRVDVDDLIVLALSLDVSPAMLLMPRGTDDIDDVVDVTGARLPVTRVWAWLTANAAPDGGPPRSVARPGWVNRYEKEKEQ